jgi:hypothetical protein
MVKRGQVWFKSGESSLLTLPGVAALMKVPYTVALRLSKSGQIPGKLEFGSKRTLYQRAVVERWIAGE